MPEQPTYSVANGQIVASTPVSIEELQADVRANAIQITNLQAEIATLQADSVAKNAALTQATVQAQQATLP